MRRVRYACDGIIFMRYQYMVYIIFTDATASSIQYIFVARMGEVRLPQRVMFEELVGGKGYSGGQEKD